MTAYVSAMRWREIVTVGGTVDVSGMAPRER
jgi:hypothetical protein